MPLRNLLRSSERSLRSSVETCEERLQRSLRHPPLGGYPDEWDFPGHFLLECHVGVQI